MLCLWVVVCVCLAKFDSLLPPIMLWKHDRFSKTGTDTQNNLKTYYPKQESRVVNGLFPPSCVLLLLLLLSKPLRCVQLNMNKLAKAVAYFPVVFVLGVWGWSYYAYIFILVGKIVNEARGSKGKQGEARGLCFDLLCFCFVGSLVSWLMETVSLRAGTFPHNKKKTRDAAKVIDNVFVAAVFGLMFHIFSILFLVPYLRAVSEPASFIQSRVSRLHACCMRKCWFAQACAHEILFVLSLCVCVCVYFCLMQQCNQFVLTGDEYRRLTRGEPCPDLKARNLPIKTHDGNGRAFDLCTCACTCAHVRVRVRVRVCVCVCVCV